MAPANAAAPAAGVCARALVESPGDGVVRIPLAPVRLRLLPPGGLTLRLAAGPLPVSYSRVRPEPPAADSCMVFFRASGIVMIHRGHHARRCAVSSECLGHFWRVWVVCGVQEYAECATPPPREKPHTRFLAPHILWGSEGGQEFIDRAEVAAAKMRVRHRFDGFQLLGWVCFQIHFRGLHLRVPEP